MALLITYHSSLITRIRYPEGLAALFDAAQAERGKPRLFEAEVCEVRQVAQHRLEPAAAREQASHARVGELRGVEGEHRQVLRSAGRGDGAQYALGEVFAEEESAAFEFEHRRHLLARLEAAHAPGLIRPQTATGAPVFERGVAARAPEPQRVLEAAPPGLAPTARGEPQARRARLFARADERPHRRGLQFDGRAVPLFSAPPGLALETLDLLLAPEDARRGQGHPLRRKQRRALREPAAPPRH